MFKNESHYFYMSLQHASVFMWEDQNTSRFLDLLIPIILCWRWLNLNHKACCSFVSSTVSSYMLNFAIVLSGNTWIGFFRMYKLALPFALRITLLLHPWELLCQADGERIELWKEFLMINLHYSNVLPQKILGKEHIASSLSMKIPLHVFCVFWNHIGKIYYKWKWYTKVIQMILCVILGVCK